MKWVDNEAYVEGMGAVVGMDVFYNEVELLERAEEMERVDTRPTRTEGDEVRSRLAGMMKFIMGIALADRRGFEVLYLRISERELSYGEIAKRVGMKNRQHVFEKLKQMKRKWPELEGVV